MNKPVSVWLHRDRIVVTVGERSSGVYDADYARKLLANIASDPAFERHSNNAGEIEYCRDCEPSIELDPEPGFTSRAELHEWLGYFR